MYIDIFICIQIGPSEQKQTHEPFICLIIFPPIEEKFSAEADGETGLEGNTRRDEPRRKCFSN